MDDHVEVEAQNESIKEKESMPENESNNESGYSELTHDNVYRLIREAIDKRAQEDLGV